MDYESLKARQLKEVQRQLKVNYIRKKEYGYDGIGKGKIDFIRIIIEMENWLGQPPLRPQPKPKPRKAIEIKSRIFIE